MTELKEYLNCCNYYSFKDILYFFIKRSGLTDSLIYLKADIDRKFFSKIRCGNNNIPKRNVVIRLGLALRLKICRILFKWF